ncbi:unnamed protein product [Polarella glacialis]|uniref:V-ATPase proteolipid subunit C-like domain-containing protein n=1 Tax=Polarella glacialis TaxID=89957 RepID=A0A813IVQ4_POLGL|nr:unnamed protein product [Polarella glacialis]
MAVYGASTLLAMQPCDPSSTFFGFMGVTSAIVFANMGAAYGTAKSGVGISSMGVMRPDMVMRSIIPVVMAGVLGIYGLISFFVIFPLVLLVLWMKRAPLLRGVRNDDGTALLRNCKTCNSGMSSQEEFKRPDGFNRINAFLHVQMCRKIGLLRKPMTQKVRWLLRKLSPAACKPKKKRRRSVNWARRRADDRKARRKNLQLARASIQRGGAGSSHCPAAVRSVTHTLGVLEEERGGLCLNVPVERGAFATARSSEDQNTKTKRQRKAAVKDEDGLLTALARLIARAKSEPKGLLQRLEGFLDAAKHGKIGTRTQKNEKTAGATGSKLSRALRLREGAWPKDAVISKHKLQKQLENEETITAAVALVHHKDVQTLKDLASAHGYTSCKLALVCADLEVAPKGHTTTWLQLHVKDMAPQLRKVAVTPLAAELPAMPSVVVRQTQPITIPNYGWRKIIDDKGTVEGVAGFLRVTKEVADNARDTKSGKAGLFVDYLAQQGIRVQVAWIVCLQDETDEDYYLRALKTAGDKGLAFRHGGGAYLGVRGAEVQDTDKWKKATQWRLH